MRVEGGGGVWIVFIFQCVILVIAIFNIILCISGYIIKLFDISLQEIQEGITSAKGDLFRTLHLILNPMRWLSSLHPAWDSFLPKLATVTPWTAVGTSQGTRLGRCPETCRRGLMTWTPVDAIIWSVLAGPLDTQRIWLQRCSCRKPSLKNKPCSWICKLFCTINNKFVFNPSKCRAYLIVHVYYLFWGGMILMGYTVHGVCNFVTFILISQDQNYCPFGYNGYLHWQLVITMGTFKKDPFLRLKYSSTTYRTIQKCW